MIAFCVFCISIDLLLDNYEEGLFKQSLIKIIFDILAIIAEILHFCYQIYMIKNLYYNYWSMCFSLGLILFIINIISITSCLILGNPDGEKSFLNSLYYYFKEVKIGYIILNFILQTIFFGFIMCLLRMLTLTYLTVNHILISYGISKLSIILLKSAHKNKWYSIIPFIFQFLSLMFFLEVFEFNFCGLNKNTKRQIEFREETDMIMRESINSNLADLGDYVIKKEDVINSQKDKNTKLQELSINDDNYQFKTQ